MVAIGITGNSQNAGSGLPTVPLFDIERDFGARGDDPTRDGPAILEAIQAAGEAGGLVVVPDATKTYRVNASTLLQAWPDGQYCLFPLPHVPVDTSTSMRPVGIVGPAGATAVMGRLYPGGGNVLQSHGAPVIQIEYDEPFTWSTDHGLPSVFATPDVDLSGKPFSNLFFLLYGLIIRQPDNPSLCNINIENAAACRIDDYYADTTAYPDQTAEPTNPTGAALLLPRAGNAVNISVGRVGAWGYYAGPAISEHARIDRVFSIANRIALPIRADRSVAHAASVGVLKAEECPFGLAGYDPSGQAPNLGVVEAPNLPVIIEQADFEDYDRNGTAPWMYTPGVGAHVYGDPRGGILAAMRVDSGPDNGDFETLSVVGATSFSIFKLSSPGTAVTRVAGHAPSNGAETIFTSQTPATSGGSGDQVDAGSSYSLGTLFTTAVDGNSTGARWYFPSTLPSQPVVAQLYQWASDVEGTLLASATFSNPTPADWNSVEWDTPVPLTAGQRYVVQVWTADHYVFGPASTLPITNGDLTAPADDASTPIRNGRLHVGTSPAYADQQASGLCFFVDVLFEKVTT